MIGASSPIGREPNPATAIAVLLQDFALRASEVAALVRIAQA
jgi:hypothetical protein